MRKKRHWLIAITALFIFCGSSSRAQTPQKAPEPSRSIVTKVIDVKYIDPNELLTVLDPFTAAGPAVRIMPNRQLNTLTLSGGPDIVAAMEAVVRKLDVVAPTKNLELTIYLLSASEAAVSTPDMPSALEPVLKQIRSTFAYKSYRLLDSVVMRGHADGSRTEAMTEGFIPHPALSEKRIPYSLRYDRSTLTHDERGDSIHLLGFRLHLDMTEFKDGKAVTRALTSGMSTNIDIRVGQMAVIGKTNFEVGNNALIAILSGRVID